MKNLFNIFDFTPNITITYFVLDLDTKTPKTLDDLDGLLKQAEESDNFELAGFLVKKKEEVLKIQEQLEEEKSKQNWGTCLELKKQIEAVFSNCNDFLTKNQEKKKLLEKKQRLIQNNDFESLIALEEELKKIE